MTLPIKNNILNVKVIPNSSTTEIREISNDVVKIAVAAPPDKNKANNELLKFLKKKFGLSFKIKSGLLSREKILQIT